MHTQEKNTQRIFLEQQTYIPILIKSFLTDRKASGLTPGTLKFYKEKLSIFTNYCEAQAITQLEQVTPDLLRRFLLAMSEKHKPGGTHAIFRSLKALLRWVDFEEIAPDWRNPISHVKAPKVAQEPIEPVPLEDVSAMLKTCRENLAGKRDTAMLLMLLDTGARAGELLALDLSDVEMDSVLIRKGKGRKPRYVYIGRKTRRALRAYLKLRHDRCPALWVSIQGERLTYDGLRAILTRRAMDTGLESVPSPHDFRRQFALSMLRNGSDVFSLQKLMGHTGLQVLRRYLAQTDDDTRAAHALASPVDRL